MLMVDIGDHDYHPQEAQATAAAEALSSRKALNDDDDNNTATKNDTLVESDDVTPPPPSPGAITTSPPPPPPSPSSWSTAASANPPPSKSLEVGDYLTLFGSGGMPLAEVAKMLDTAQSDITCGLTRRCSRRYVNCGLLLDDTGSESTRSSSIGSVGDLGETSHRLSCGLTEL
uniref:Uncharacterized protein n=1 Tax=Octactis speculum TaxID=3111310 RepID=A0A7S2G4R1_9STRA